MCKFLTETNHLDCLVGLKLDLWEFSFHVMTQKIMIPQVFHIVTCYHNFFCTQHFFLFKHNCWMTYWNIFNDKGFEKLFLFCLSGSSTCNFYKCLLFRRIQTEESFPLKFERKVDRRQQKEERNLKRKKWMN